MSDLSGIRKIIADKGVEEAIVFLAHAIDVVVTEMYKLKQAQQLPPPQANLKEGT